jgi:hypothetical protein
MDVQMYGFVVPTLIATWHSPAGRRDISKPLRYSCRPSVDGLRDFFADRIGRVRTLQLAILWFAVFAFFPASRKTEQLLIARALLGLASAVVGRGRRSSWGIDSGGASRKSAWHHAGRLGYRMGNGDGPLRRVVYDVAGKQRRGAYCSWLGYCRRCWCSLSDDMLKNRSLPRVASKSRRERRSAVVFEIFKPPLLRVTLIGG